MSFNLMMQPPTLRPGDDLAQYFIVFEYYCSSVKASDQVKRHLLLSAINNNLKWALQDKDCNLYEVEYEVLKERALRHKDSGQHAERRRDELIGRVQLPGESSREFVYALRALGDIAYRNGSDAALRNEMLYVTLLRGLHDRRLANSIPSLIKYSRDFASAAQMVIDHTSSPVIEVAAVESNTPDMGLILKKLEAMEIRTLQRTDELTRNISAMEAEISTLKRTNEQLRYSPVHSGERRCFECNRPGHFKRECPFLGTTGAKARGPKGQRSMTSCISRHADLTRSKRQRTIPSRARKQQIQPGVVNKPVNSRSSSAPAPARFVSLLKQMFTS
uniref:Uncharacterized protein zf(Cchc)-8 n=1 Tax=Phallusia mammillata TaxID=59560 RepID=A0A6F9DWZ1_9ASCI|nr:uncharacterized protein zf(cchc)-8 [Phallusia mammillata]